VTSTIVGLLLAVKDVLIWDMRYVNRCTNEAMTMAAVPLLLHCIWVQILQHSKQALHWNPITGTIQP
jgi:hypothetical protein